MTTSITVLTLLLLYEQSGHDFEWLWDNHGGSVQVNGTTLILNPWPPAGLDKVTICASNAGSGGYCLWYIQFNATEATQSLDTWLTGDRAMSGYFSGVVTINRTIPGYSLVIGPASKTSTAWFAIINITTSTDCPPPIILASRTHTVPFELPDQSLLKDGLCPGDDTTEMKQNFTIQDKSGSWVLEWSAPTFVIGINTLVENTPVRFTVEYAPLSCGSAPLLQFKPSGFQTNEDYFCEADGQNCSLSILKVQCLSVTFNVTVVQPNISVYGLGDSLNYIKIPVLSIQGEITTVLSTTSTVGLSPAAVTATTTISGTTSTVSAITTTSGTTSAITETTTTISGITTTPVSDTTVGSSAVASTTSTSMCMCDCLEENRTMTDTRLKKLMDEIRKDMAINISELSSTRRKLKSAKDERSTAAGLGYAGVVIIVFYLGVLVSLDVSVLVRDFRKVIRNINQRVYAHDDHRSYQHN